MDSKFIVVAFAILIALVSGGGLVWWYNSSSAPCNKMAECQDNFGACVPQAGYNGYNGDACCSEGSAFKCVEDMTIYERITKDAAYAKMINCVLAEHPDLASVKQCLPKPTDCKSPRWCPLGSDESKAQIEKCPKLLKCWLQKHSNLAQRCVRAARAIQRLILMISESDMQVMHQGDKVHKVQLRCFEASRFALTLVWMVNRGNFLPNMGDIVGLPVPDNAPNYVNEVLNRSVQLVQICGNCEGSTIKELDWLGKFLQIRGLEIRSAYPYLKNIFVETSFSIKQSL